MERTVDFPDRLILSLSVIADSEDILFVSPHSAERGT